MNILVINSGSSSLKFQIINTNNSEVLMKGHVDGIGLDTCKLIINKNEQDVKVKNHVEAIDLVLHNIDKDSLTGIGHRFVHGGLKYKEAVLITDEVLADLEELNELAPLHNPHNLAGIKACQKLLSIPQIAVFDTGFHHDIPKKAHTYAIPKDISDKYGIRKFGFHGISHNYLMLEAQRLLGQSQVNIITCHLGNGASISCIKENKCIDTSMGFTPLAGLVMGTRSGDIDLGLALFLQEKLSLNNKELNDLFNKKSGLIGLCNKSDMREIHAKVLESDEDAVLALDVFNNRIIHYVGAYLAQMQDKTDAIIFSGGIGEGGFYIRKTVCLALKHLGVEIDSEKNNTNNGLIREPTFINTNTSKIKVLVIPTNEELLIALETSKILDKKIIEIVR